MPLHWQVLLWFLVCAPTVTHANEQRWATFSQRVLPQLAIRQPIEDRRAALREFASEDYPKAAAHLIGILEARRVPLTLKRMTTKILAGYQNSDAQALIAQAAEDSKGTNLYLLEAYIAQKSPESRPFLLHLLRNAKSPAAQSIALDGLLFLPAAEVSDGFVNALINWVADEDTFHGIRLSATRLLGAIPNRKIIPFLIETLDDPLLTEESLASLLRLTGQPIGVEATAWDAWFQQQPATYLPEPMGLHSFEVVLRKRKADRAVAQQDHLEFFGRKLEGKRILFLLDNSGSMDDDGRIERLQDEMKGMIQNLTPAYSFGIITFPGRRTPGRDFDQANSRYREMAYDFADGMYASGSTPMGGALEEAFDRLVRRKNVDTIYLLSDGEPTDVDADDSLPELVLRLNEEARVRIHTLFIGDALAQPTARDLMEQVAEENEGTFMEVP
ncbi:MAG: VWA domain-containing protein [Verrucomicrobiota bacterium]